MVRYGIPRNSSHSLEAASTSLAAERNYIPILCDGTRYCTCTGTNKEQLSLTHDKHLAPVAVPLEVDVDMEDATVKGALETLLV